MARMTPSILWRVLEAEIKRHGFEGWATTEQGDHYAVSAVLKNGKRIEVGTCMTVPPGGIMGISRGPAPRQRTVAQWKQEYKRR